VKVRGDNRAGAFRPADTVSGRDEAGACRPVLRLSRGGQTPRL